MPDVSIALKFEGNLSQAIVGMRNAVTPFRNDIGSLQKELTTLNSTKFALKLDLSGAKSAAKEAQKAFEELGEAATDVERAAAMADWSEAEAHYENVRSQLDLVSKQARQTEKDMLSATDAISKADNRAGRSGGGSMSRMDMVSAVAKAGLIKMGGDVASQWANILVGSGSGQEIGTLFGGALSGAASGAALGSIVPGVGTAVGAVGGGLLGLAGSAGQVYQQRDDAFKTYVQEQTQGQMDSMKSDTQAGSAIASQREQDAIAFNRLLGEGIGDQYLKDLRVMAAATPMEYSDLTGMSRSLATGFSGDPQRMLKLMSGIGDAGSAVGIDASGMTEMAKSMSRMQSSGKATLEYLNIFQERGVDAIGMIASNMSLTKNQVYDLISKGKLDGLAAVDAIQAGMEQMYSGAMELQSQTFSGLSSTLADAQAEMQNAYGDGFNETRKKGLQDEIDFLSGESGAMIQEANRAMGAFQADLENSKEQFVRDAMAATMDSEEYKAAMSQGTDEGYAEAGRMLMAAKVRGMNEYNASEGAQLMLEMEISLAGAIREDSASNSAFYNAGYTKGQEYSRGLAAAMEYSFDNATLFGSSIRTRGSETIGGSGSQGSGHAFGLNRVPYDNYAALLHEGERVLTASEARSADQGGGVNVNISGNQFTVREEGDIDKIALAIADMIELAQMSGAGR